MAAPQTPNLRESVNAVPGADSSVFDAAKVGNATLAQIVLPWPPKQLTPNFKRRKHWSSYRPHTVQYRADCAVLIKKARVRGSLLTVTFCPPDRRRRDDDGMIGAFKAGRDGIADALGCDDHTFRPTYKFGEPVKGGAVLVEIGELF